MKWFKTWVFIMILILGTLLRSYHQPHPFPFMNEQTHPKN